MILLTALVSNSCSRCDLETPIPVPGTSSARRHVLAGIWRNLYGT
ncbi:MAG: hypothetical protein QXL28_02400 [Desulfurococcaceae archaeon]